MKKLTSVAFAALLATTGAAAFAEDTQKADQFAPVAMTDDQLDTVAAGLINIVAVDVIDVSNNDVQILNNSINGNQVAIPVSIAVLGNSQAVSLQRR